MNRIWIVISLLCSQLLYSEIKEIHQLNEMEQMLPESLTDSDWILFDIDHTLTIPDHPALQLNSLKQFKCNYKERYAQLSKEEKQLIYMLIITHAHSRLTEPDVPHLIERLSNTEATIFGFTGAGTYVIPTIGEIPFWRSCELERLGIHFSSAIKRLEFLDFTPFRGSYPLFMNGVLYTNSIFSKGEVLTAFMEKTQQTPRRIFFVDDSLEYLSSVEDAMKKKGIPFIGFHYVPEGDFPPSDSKEWDKVWKEILNRFEQLAVPTGILRTSSPSAIEWAVDLSSEDSLIIFDVGNVILVPHDVVLQKKYRPWIIDWLDKEGVQLEKALLKVVDQEMKMDLVNEKIPQIIQQSKSKSNVLILSKHLIGKPLPDQPSFEEHRLQSLKEVGVDLGEPFPQAVGWYDAELKAIYAYGLLQAEAPLKGPVLLAFLKEINWQPKSIVFVDDREDQCESIRAAAETLGIPTLCIHYTEAQEYVPPLDPIVADHQLRTLLNERRWISDEEACQILSQTHR